VRRCTVEDDTLFILPNSALVGVEYGVAEDAFGVELDACEKMDPNSDEDGATAFREAVKIKCDKLSCGINFTCRPTIRP